MDKKCLLIRLQHSFCLTLILTIVSSQILCAQTPNLRDPTQPPATEAAASETNVVVEPIFVLQSIIISPTRKLAVINDKFVKVGDQMGDLKVEQITKNTVVLSKAGKKLTIYLFEKPHLE